jgi:regulator of replication initiation timing
MDIVSQLEEQIKQLTQELNDTKEHLKKYTAPSRSKTFYENHKEELLEKMKKYTPSPEKIKEKNRKAYLKRKEKLAQQEIPQ